MKFKDFGIDISRHRSIRIEDLLRSEQKEILSIYEGIDECIYIADPDTYKILYANKTLKKEFGDIAGKKCYKVFQNLQAPCSFCSNEYIFGKNLGKAYIWDFQNKKNGRWYHCIDKAIHWPDGRLVRFEIAIDITGRKDTEEALRKNKEELEITNKKLLKLNRKLEHLALKDLHTGLYNHRYFEEIIESEFYRAKRYFHPLSLIMLDIDYFRSINDVYGHHFGDLVLKQFAKKLRKLVRLHDYVIRFGGEEFVIILSGSDRQGTLTLAQRALGSIRIHKFGDAKNTVNLRLSAAVVSYPEDNIFKSMDLIELADQILNRAKECGGDKVCSFIDIKNNALSLSEEIKVTDSNYLKQKLSKLTKKVNQSLVESIFAFAKTIELKDYSTGNHVERTVYYATETARTLGLSQVEIVVIEQAAILHDLGKIGITEKILLKKETLTKEEFDRIKQHPKIGIDIIRPIQFLHGLVPLILYHHERWDGKGYPSGLKGQEIPVGARIIAIADVYQALISDRPYRKALSKDEAIEIIRENSGTQFDPRIANVFLKILQPKDNRHVSEI